VNKVFKKVLLDKNFDYFDN